VEPQLGPSVGTLYFGHGGNHYVALKPKQRASSYATAVKSSRGNSEQRTCSFFRKIKRQESAQETKKSSSKTFKAKRTTTTKIPKGGKNQEMEGWESTEEYNLGTSLWRERKIFDDTSSCGSDIEITEEKAAPKDELLKKCKLEINTTVGDTSDQSVVEISSDDGMEVDSPLKQPTRKRQRISSDDSIEELIASVSGLSSNDNTPQKPRLPPVKRPKEQAHGSPAKQKLSDDEYVIILFLM